MTATGLHARSLLFVPGDRPERFEKAVAASADCIIIDLEDAVSPGNKPQALGHALDWLASGEDAVIRVNGVGTPWHVTELAALAETGSTIMLPKSQTIEDIESVSATAGRRIIALVETAQGVRDVDAIAVAPGVLRLALGNVDLATELGVEPGSHGALAYPRGRLVMASAAAGLAEPIDGVTTGIDAPDTLSADLIVTRDLGFGGKLCIHPRQVQAVNDALSPTRQELEWASTILTGSPVDGVDVIDGQMVDPPVIRRAERLISRSSEWRLSELGAGRDSD